MCEADGFAGNNVLEQWLPSLHADSNIGVCWCFILFWFCIIKSSSQISLYVGQRGKGNWMINIYHDPKELRCKQLAVTDPTFIL